GWSEITLNVVSLMGLVLALGMLLDNSIVVIESIYRRMEELGEDARTAALKGASEVALPITAATATTLCVFIPMIFLGGGGGFFARYMEEIGLTVCIVLVASLLVALTVVPMAAALLLGRERPQRTRFFDWLGDRYEGILRFTLHHRLVFLALSALTLYGSWSLITSIERTSSSRTEERRVTINVDTGRGFTLDQTREVFDEIAGLLDEHRDELDIADVAYNYHTGGGRSRGWDRERRFEIFLKDESESTLSTTEARDRIRDLLPQRPGVALRIAQSTGRHGSQGLELEISGDDPRVLETIGREVAAKIAYNPTLKDVDLSLESGDDEVRVDVKRERAVQAGVSSRLVAQTIQSSLTDRALSYLKAEDRDVDLIVRFRDEDRETLEQLRTVPVTAAQGSQPLDALASFAVEAGPQSIDRENRRPKLTITANPTSPRAMFGAMAGVRQLMAQQAMPPGYSWSFGRWNRMGEQDQQSSSFALLFAGLLVYLLMAALFESFSHPFSIMCSIPFAFIGVGAIMKLTGQPRDSFTDLGFIILVGVVVNNAIVLVDHVNRLRQEGVERTQAILTGGRHRLRAILMTAITTILGLLP
ncbi:MAG: efflux RND transporter permease subunit, partial [Acidobacteria bacterium]|nr:efflux RND transporter permease subunit [Acidobacteriota bacterium]